MCPPIYDVLLTLPGHVPVSTSSGVSSRLFIYFLFLFSYLLTYFFYRMFVLASIYLPLYNSLLTLSEMSTLSSLITIYMLYLFLIHHIFSLIY